MTKNVVTIGGGAGTYNALRALKLIPNIAIHAIVSMGDDGGSTGRLRDTYGVLPSGDIRRAITALADDDKNQILRDIFTYRFTSGDLAGHNVGNLITMALEETYGGFDNALSSLRDLFAIDGYIYPVTLDKTRLVALLEDGTYVIGEKNIDVPQHDGTLRIVDLFAVKEEYVPRIRELVSLMSHSLESDIGMFVESVGINIDAQTIHDSVQVLFDYYISHDTPLLHPRIGDVLSQADYIIVASGDVYTSILPNMIIGDCAHHIVNSSAKKMIVANLFTKYGETHNFVLEDIIREYSAYLGEDIFDTILVHDWDRFPIPQEMYHKYIDEKKQPIRPTTVDNRIVMKDVVSAAGYARHDIDKLRNAFLSWINEE